MRSVEMSEHPCDRLPVAQAQVEAAALLTVDRQLREYSGDIRFAG